MEVANLPGCEPQGGEELLVHQVERALDDLPRNAKLLRAAPIEAQGVLADGDVTTLAHIVHYPLGSLHGLPRKCA